MAYKFYKKENEEKVYRASSVTQLMEYCTGSKRPEWIQVKEVSTYIDIDRVMYLNFQKKELMNNLSLINEPVRKFKIGDYVGTESIMENQGLYVSEIEEGGKILLIENEKLSMYVPWHRLHFMKNLYPKKESSRIVKEINVREEPVRISLTYLIERYYERGVDMSENRYAENKWSLEKRVSYMTAIIKGYPTGTFCLEKNSLTENYMYGIMDGRERLKAIIAFYEDKIQIEGKTYTELADIDKRFFKEIMVNVIEYRNLNSKDNIEIETIITYLRK